MSLWQSAVSQAVADRIADGNPAHPAVRTDPYAAAVNRLAASRHTLHLGLKPELSEPTTQEKELAATISETGLHTHEAAIDELAATDAVRDFSNSDPRFLVECVGNFIKWYLQRGPRYRDWRKYPEKLAFGIIKYELPSDGRIALIGDWGTGMDDARAMLTDLLKKTRPMVIIHLGDIYYSGTPQEAKFNFLEAIDGCCREAGLDHRLPVFNIPGNHDYYSGGLGFYEILDVTNSGDELQAASYFCLRSRDQRWQFVGLDTGRHDHVPGLPFEPFYSAPRLDAGEVEWAADKIGKFPGQTILLTHHQLFSARSALNGTLSLRPADRNESLLQAFAPLFSKIAVWFWGHEHNLALYKRGLYGLRKGRLLGCSAFELSAGGDNKPLFEDVTYDSPEVQLGTSDQWLNHACAVIDLGEETVDYFEFPSWGDGGRPDDALLTVRASESILGERRSTAGRWP